MSALREALEDYLRSAGLGFTPRDEPWLRRVRGVPRPGRRLTVTTELAARGPPCQERVPIPLTSSAALGGAGFRRIAAVDPARCPLT